MPEEYPTMCCSFNCLKSAQTAWLEKERPVASELFAKTKLLGSYSLDGRRESACVEAKEPVELFTN